MIPLGSSEADEAEGDLDHPEERCFQLFVSCGDAAELLYLAEQPLHSVALPIALGVVRPRVRPVFAIRDVGKHILVDARLALGVAVEAFVAGHLNDNKTVGTRDMHFFTLPWPVDELRRLGEVSVTMKVTLSYFVLPSPGRRG